MRVEEHERDGLLVIDLVFTDLSIVTQEEDTIGNVIYEAAGDKDCAVDFDGPSGEVESYELPYSFHALIKRKNLAKWRKAAKRFGGRVDVRGEPEDGHYGDQAHEVVDVVAVPNRDGWRRCSLMSARLCCMMQMNSWRRHPSTQAPKT